ncbi:hypothetical protein E2C01_011956 [Portunus trituberculatus]|uniref:Uncharacterized protein n=1 Tax=Portunus trituberculatus TaxID=210409 RepID=A0A5B7DCJ6_PORTR|nr:hypothetical protein [Portunus trituberculatus]
MKSGHRKLGIQKQAGCYSVYRRGTVKPFVLCGPRGLQAHGFESCPRSECRLGFLTRGNGFLADKAAGTTNTKEGSNTTRHATRAATPGKGDTYTYRRLIKTATKDTGIGGGRGGISGNSIGGRKGP